MSASAPPSRSLKIFRRVLLALAVLAAAGWGGRWIWKQVSPGLFGNKRVDRIPTARVKAANIAEEIVTVGRVRAVFSTELRAEINGRITKIYVVDGQPVKREQKILELDQQDIVTQLQEAERNIVAAKLRAEKAKHDAERLSPLQPSGIIAAKDLDDARTAQQLAENDSSIYEARAANLRDKLSKTVIRAPHDGTLLLRDLTENQVITGVIAQNGGTLLGEVADLSALMVRTNVNEIDVARIFNDQAAHVRIDPLRNLMLDGVVKRIATSANESPVDRTRVFPVDVVISTPDARLRPGMSSTVTFTLSHAEATPAIPLSAVFTTAESVRYVFLHKGETFEPRAVDIGIADTRRVQVLGGLELGDEVALSRPLEYDGEIPAPPAAATPAGKLTTAAAPARPGS